MKAIAIAQFGGPENLRLMDMPDPKPVAGEALVKLEYAGINLQRGHARNRYRP